jgi:hypothetical protein
MSNKGGRGHEMTEEELIYDWNSVEKVGRLSPKKKFTFFDETLRDGIQSPSVVDPRIEDKIQFTEIASTTSTAGCPAPASARSTTAPPWPPSSATSA